MCKYFIGILLFILVLFSGCKSAIKPTETLILSDTSYFQRLDTSFISGILFPKYEHKGGNNMSVTIPYLPPTNADLPVKDKKGKVIGNAKVKIKSNNEGNIDFTAEIEQTTDSIPKILQVVQTETKIIEKRSFFDKLGDNVLDFLNIIFLIVGAGIAWLIITIIKKRIKK